MSYEISKIKFTPGNSVVTSAIANFDIQTIDCTDLGSLGVFTDSTNWIAGVKVVVTTYGANEGVTISYADIHMVSGSLYITNSGHETSSSGIGDLFLVVSGTDILVRLNVTTDNTLYHAPFVECGVQKIG